MSKLPYLPNGPERPEFGVDLALNPGGVLDQALHRLRNVLPRVGQHPLDLATAVHKVHIRLWVVGGSG